MNRGRLARLAFLTMGAVLAAHFANQAWRKEPGRLTVVTKRQTDRRDRLSGGSGGAAFQLLVGGAGQSAMLTPSQFYSAFSSEFTGTGAWFFDGANASTLLGTTFTATGTPTAVTHPTCNNGPNCSSYGARRYPGVVGSYHSGSTAAPAGDFSVVLMLKPHIVTGATQDVVNQYAGTTTNASSLVRLGTTGIPQAIVFNAAGSSTTLAFGSALSPRSWNLVVVTYTRTGGAADNVLKVYVNGSASATTTSSAVLSNAAANPAWRIGEEGNGTLPYPGDIAFVALANKALSAATIDAMANAALGLPLTTADGASVTTARAGLLTCTNDSWLTLTTQPAARHCVAAYGLECAPGTTNLVPQSEDFATTWGANAGSPSISVNTWTAPDGTATGDTLTDNDAASVESLVQSPAVTSGTAYTWSIWAKSNSGSPMTDFRFRMGGAGFSGCNATTSATLTSTATRYVVTGTACATNNAALVIEQASAASTGAYDIWGSHFEAAAYATPYVRTEASTVTRAAASHSVSSATWPAPAGEIRFRFRPGAQPAGGTLYDVSTTLTADGYILFFLATGALRFTHRASGANTNTDSTALVWTPAQWYSMRVTWGAGVKKVYRDGVEVVSATGATLPASLPTTAYIGNRSTAADAVFGSIADFEVSQ